MRRLLLLVLIFGSVNMLIAQNCTQKLNQAEDDYEAGRLLGIPDLIRDCLNSGGFSREEEIRARKLLTLVYIFTDNEGLAEVSLIRLLRADPEHKLDPQVDPAELFFLYNQFRVRPVFRVAVRGGVNFSSPQILGAFNTASDPRLMRFYNGKTSDGRKSYQIETEGGPVEFTPSSSLGIGFWGEVAVERYLLHGIEVGAGLQLRSSVYHVENYINKLFLYTAVSNRQLYVRTPVFARYNLFYERGKKVVPYVTVGGSFDYLLSARYTDASRTGGTAYTLNTNDDLVSLEMVNRHNYSLFAGIGAKFRVNTHFVTLEARYDNSGLNYINPENRISGNQSSTFDLGFVEDDLFLDFFSISIGWTHSIYSPKKIK